MKKIVKIEFIGQYPTQESIKKALSISEMQNLMAMLSLIVRRSNGA
jgi:hypothetical protein